jgi:hypothetical protein
MGMLAGLDGPRKLATRNVPTWSPAPYLRTATLGGCAYAPVRTSQDTYRGTGGIPRAPVPLRRRRGGGGTGTRDCSTCAESRQAPSLPYSHPRSRFKPLHALHRTGCGYGYRVVPCMGTDQIGCCDADRGFGYAPLTPLFLLGSDLV